MKRTHIIIVVLCLTLMILNLCVKFEEPKKISPEVQEFKHGLEIDNILDRTEKCSIYFEKLRRLIFSNVAITENPRTLLKPKERKDGVRLAMSFVVHSQPGLFEILLHLMFRPWNAYCIYIDAKTSARTRQAFQSIVNCYQEIFPRTNIFLVASPKSVSWGTYSLLNADLTCLEQLLDADKSWKYYMNFAGSELPLMDIDDFGERLKKLSPQYSIVSFFEPNLKEDRLHYSIKEIEPTHPSSLTFTFYKTNDRYNSYTRTSNLKSPVPYNMTVYKGWKNVILSRNFSRFALTHPVAKTFRNWTQDMEIPDEEFFATLARITDIEKDLETGNFLVKQVHVKELPILPGLCPRITLWDIDSDYQCYGKTVRNICHLSLKDLQYVMLQKNLQVSTGKDQDCLVANKFNLEVDAEPIMSLARYLSPFVAKENSNLHLNGDPVDRSASE